jgi:hypothetical protein
MEVILVKNSKGLILSFIALVTAVGALHLYSDYVRANSIYTISTTAGIANETVYIDETNQAKSTITINAQVLKNGSSYVGEVDYWEVSIWRINEYDQPIHSGFQKTVKVQDTSPTLQYQRDIYTSVGFLKGEQQARQRFAYRVMVYLDGIEEESEGQLLGAGNLSSGIGYLEEDETDGLVVGVGYLGEDIVLGSIINY